MEGESSASQLHRLVQLGVIPAVYRNLAFDPIKDFAHPSLMSKKPTVLVANPAFAPKDAAEYLVYARANSGKINFGTTGNLLPSVPTISEKGIPGYDYSYWTGFSAPAATHPAIVKKLSEGFASVARSSDVVAALEAEGAVAIGSSPEQFRQLLLAETALWRKVVRDSGIIMED